MKNKKELSMGLTIVLIFSLLLPLFIFPEKVIADTTDPQIVLDINMVTLVSGGSNYEALVDEQDVVDPDKPETFWNPGNNNYPGIAYIDLGSRHHITQISLFDGTGHRKERPYLVEYGNPGDWHPIVEDTLEKFNTWNNHKVDIYTRYIQVVVQDYSPMHEIRLYGTEVPPDLIAPAAISDLTATAMDDYIKLDWTAPGNDGDVGTASVYDIRYSTELITADNWDQALLVPGIPEPEIAGTPQTVNVHGLEEETTYYFAMTAADDWDVPNVSELSNVASATTNEDAFPPADITDLTGSIIGSSAITFTWTATGDNGLVGSADSYDLRYSTSPVSDLATEQEWWDAATIAAGLPVPQISGQTETYELTGLEPTTTYYVAMIATDKKDNQSSIHNVIEVTTVEKDVTAPGKIENLQVNVPDLMVSSATFNWTAPGDDEYTGTATSYQFRYSTKPLDEDDSEDWWNEATPVTSGLPVPAEAGNVQALQLEDLDKGIFYYAAMKTVDKEGNISELSNGVKFGFADKLTLKESMVINEQGTGSGIALVDEQHLGPFESGLPNPQSFWKDIDKFLDSYSAVIDLGHEYYIKELYLFDSSGTGNVKGYLGTPFNWGNSVFTDTLSSFNSWNKHEIDAESRYVRLEMVGGNNPYEVIIYGIGPELEEKVIEPVDRPYALMRDFIGINGFIDDPLDKLAVGGTLREYHNWRWDDHLLAQYPNNPKAYAPSAAAGGAWNFDWFYESLVEMGIEVFPNIKESLNDIYGGIHSKPVFPEDDAEDPFSYERHADHMFQYVARYGSNEVDPSLLKLREDQPVRSGLGLLKYFENENEPNKNWFGRREYATPYEHAALASADYDGHMGLMGPNIGVKNADPNAKMVMAGLVGNFLDIKYIQAMKFWSDHHRVDEEGNTSFPADVLNLHHYSREYTGVDYIGISPEEDGLKARVEKLANWRNEHLPDLELWISEFGYDTHPNSPQRAAQIKDFSRERVQAQWLTRSYLVMAAGGVDRVQMYMMRDVDPSCATQYCTSGLTSSQATGYVPKPSWYYVYTLKNQLGDMRFVKEIEDVENRGVMIYMFQSDAGEKAYVLWSPTADQVEINQYPFYVDGGFGFDMMTQVKLADQYVNGIHSYLVVEDDKVMVNVSEDPIIIREGAIHDPSQPYWEEGSKLTVEDQTITTMTLSWPAANGQSKVNYYSIYNGDQWLKTVPASVTSYELTGLQEGETYELRVYAGDIIGKETQVALTDTLLQPDVTAPSTPKNPAALISTGTQVMLTWEASTDNIGVVGYRIYTDTQQLLSTAPSDKTLFTVDGLKPSTEYTLVVVAVDRAGNESEPSEQVTIKTSAIGGGGGGSGAVIPQPLDTSPATGAAIRPEFSVESEGIGQQAGHAAIHENQIRQAIQALRKDAAEPVIHIATPHDLTSAGIQLTAGSVLLLQEQLPEASIRFQSGKVTYDLPVRLLDLDKVAEELEVPAHELSIHLKVSGTSWSDDESLHDALREQGMTFLSEMIEFELWAQSPNGNAYLIDDFGDQYVHRTISLAQYIDPSKATAVVYDPASHQVRFVPALFISTNSGTTIIIKSNSNSLYAIVSMNKTFHDIANSYAKGAIELLASKHIINGRTSERFDPQGTITRSEFAAMLVRALGMKELSGSSHFADVSNEWFATAVHTAAQSGLMIGDGHKFRPGDDISRQEAALILYRAIQQIQPVAKSNQDALGAFKDASEVSEWAREALNELVANGILSGFDDQTVRADQSLTREQTAVLLRKVLQTIKFMN